MPKSTSLLATIGTVITNTPNAASLALAIAPAGPIMDYAGNTRTVQLHFQEVVNQLIRVKSVTDSTDTANLALINGLLAVLNGTGSPSTAAITDLATVITNGPNAATLALAIAPAGPIMDYIGNVQSARLKLREALNTLNRLVTVTDSTDSANLTLLGNLVLVLV